VNDVEIVEGMRLLAETTGIFGETAAGVTVAAARTLARNGKLSPDDEVVLCITGNGLKTTDAVSESLVLPEPIAPRLSELAALVAHQVHPDPI
jgi:threonine synthase